MSNKPILFLVAGPPQVGKTVFIDRAAERYLRKRTRVCAVVPPSTPPFRTTFPVDVVDNIPSLDAFKRAVEFAAVRESDFVFVETASISVDVSDLTAFETLADAFSRTIFCAIVDAESAEEALAAPDAAAFPTSRLLDVAPIILLNKADRLGERERKNLLVRLAARYPKDEANSQDRDARLDPNARFKSNRHFSATARSGVGLEVFLREVIGN